MPVVGELTNGNHRRRHVGTIPAKEHSILISLTQSNSCTRWTLAEPRHVSWHGSLPLSLLSRAPRTDSRGFPFVFNGTDRTDRLANTRILHRYARFLSWNNLPNTLLNLIDTFDRRISGGSKQGATLFSDSLRVSSVAAANLSLSPSRGFGFVASDRIRRGNEGVAQVSDGLTYIWPDNIKVRVVRLSRQFLYGSGF